jgi:hypothetical protein
MNDAVFARPRVRQLSEGDTIRVSERQTPMTVTKIETSPSGSGVKVTAENRYGEYQIRAYPNEQPVLYAPDRQLEGTTEVECLD